MEKWKKEYERVMKDPLAFYHDYYNVLNPEEPVESRKSNFVLLVGGYLRENVIPDLTSDLRDSFIKYWTTITQRGRKLKFEKEDTFDIPARLRTWIANDKKFKTIKLTNKLFGGRNQKVF